MNQLVRSESINESQMLSREEYIDSFYRIYQKVNETAKEVSRVYTDNLKLEQSDISELHIKVMQTINSLSPRAVNLKINLEQAKGESHTFKSFEDFNTHNTTSPYAVTDLYLQYKFITHDAVQNKFENYVVSIRLVSRLAAIDQIKNSSSEEFASFFMDMRSTTAGIEVEYYDYVKARSFTATFDEWVAGCKSTKPNKMLVFLKKHSKKIIPIGNVFIMIIMALLTIKAIDFEVIDLKFAVKFAIAYFSLFASIKIITNIFLKLAVLTIGRYIPLSYIKINKGDENLIEKYEKSNEKNIFLSMLNLFFTILIGLSTSYIYDVIKVILK